MAKLQLEAAQKEADALVAKGEAEAAVILLHAQAEAEPLRQQVAAFGDGQAYAQYFFYQKRRAVDQIDSGNDGRAVCRYLPAIRRAGRGTRANLLRLTP